MPAFIRGKRTNIAEITYLKIKSTTSDRHTKSKVTALDDPTRFVSVHLDTEAWWWCCSSNHVIMFWAPRARCKTLCIGLEQAEFLSSILLLVLCFAWLSSSVVAYMCFSLNQLGAATTAERIRGNTNELRSRIINTNHQLLKFIR